jgi:hypothetical protein
MQMSLAEQYIPAVPGTMFLTFKFFPSVKSNETQVREGASGNLGLVQRPVLAWRVGLDNRPFPISVALPIEIDVEAPGVDAVIIGNQIFCPLTGECWSVENKMQSFIRYIVTRWQAYLEERKLAPPVVEPQPARPVAFALPGTVTSVAPATSAEGPMVA